MRGYWREGCFTELLAAGKRSDLRCCADYARRHLDQDCTRGRCGRGLTKSRWNRFPDTRNRNRFPRRDLRCVSWSDTARDAAMGHLVPNCPPSPRARQVVLRGDDPRARRDSLRGISLRCRLAVTRNVARARRNPFRGAPRLCCRRFSMTPCIFHSCPDTVGVHPAEHACDKDSHLERGHEAAFIDKCGNIGGRAAASRAADSPS